MRLADRDYGVFIYFQKVHGDFGGGKDIKSQEGKKLTVELFSLISLNYSSF